MILGTLIVLGIGMLAAPPAHAYLDPGSGSMMVQLLLAGVAGFAVALRMVWRRLLAFLGLYKDAASKPKSPSS